MILERPSQRDGVEMPPVAIPTRAGVVQEIYSDLSTHQDRNYTKVCSLVPETPDRHRGHLQGGQCSLQDPPVVTSALPSATASRYRSHRRFDKFRVNRGATRPVWAVAVAEARAVAVPL
eukprot:Skav205183  [mRNA]  locus=scaffold1333:94645:95982:+ [translate_table: standard]